MANDTTPRLDPFTRGYIECALWCGMDDDGGPELVLDDLTPQAFAQLVKDAQDFLVANEARLTQVTDAMVGLVHDSDMLAYLGHDFWLTRNRHGAGFWDRGLGSVGTELTNMAHAYGEASLYRGDDGMVYHA